MAPDYFFSFFSTFFLIFHLRCACYFFVTLHASLISLRPLQQLGQSLLGIKENLERYNLSLVCSEPCTALMHVGHLPCWP